MIGFTLKMLQMHLTPVITAINMSTMMTCRHKDGNVEIGIAIPDLNFQSRDSGLPNSQSRDPVGIGVVQLRLLKLPRGLRYSGRYF